MIFWEYSISVIGQKSSGNEKTLRKILGNTIPLLKVYHISHIRDRFKSKLVQQYNNDNKNAYKNNNPKQTGYVFEQPSSSQPNLFTESASERLGDNSENLYVQTKNSYRGRAVLEKQLILVTATGDVSTVVHEYAHWYLGILQDAD